MGTKKWGLNLRPRLLPLVAFFLWVYFSYYVWHGVLGWDGDLVAVMSMLTAASTYWLVQWMQEKNERFQKITIISGLIVLILGVNIVEFIYRQVEYDIVLDNLDILGNMSTMVLFAFTIFFFAYITIRVFAPTITFFGMKLFYRIMGWWSTIQKAESHPFEMPAQGKTQQNSLRQLFAYCFVELIILAFLLLPLMIVIFPDREEFSEIIVTNLFSLWILILPFSAFFTAKILNITRKKRSIDPSIFHKLWSLSLVIVFIQIIMNANPNWNNIIVGAMYILISAYAIAIAFIIQSKRIEQKGLILSAQESSKNYLTVTSEGST